MGNKNQQLFNDGIVHEQSKIAIRKNGASLTI